MLLVLVLVLAILQIGAAGRSWKRKQQAAITELQNKVADLLAKSPEQPCQSGVVEHETDWVNYDQNFFPHTTTVTFSKPFDREPVVSFGIVGLDVLKDYNTRVKCRAGKISEQSFDLTCEEWGDTKLYKVQVAWIAC